jgi:hypothetical protein
MAISFNPGQASAAGGADTGGFSSAAPTTNPNATPVDKYIPTAIPTIAQQEDTKDTSPLVFLNRNHSKFALYFQIGVFVIFLGNLAAVIGLFAYMGVLNAQVESKKQELATAQAGFPDLKIDEMQQVARRIRIVNTVLSEQSSVRTAFRILEESISNPVTYNKFSLSKNRGKKGYNLNFAGDTAGYENLYQQIEALQSKIFSSYFIKPEVSGIGPLDKKGIGSFKINTAIAIEGLFPDSFTVKEKEEYLRSLLPKEDTGTSTTNTPVIPQGTQ